MGREVFHIGFRDEELTLDMNLWPKITYLMPSLLQHGEDSDPVSPCTTSKEKRVREPSEWGPLRSTVEHSCVSVTKPLWDTGPNPEDGCRSLYLTPRDGYRTLTW